MRNCIENESEGRTTKSNVFQASNAFALVSNHTPLAYW